MATFSKNKKHIKALYSEGKYILSRASTLKYLFNEKEQNNLEGKRVNIYHGYLAHNFYFPELIDHLEKKEFSVRAPNLPFWQRIKEISEKEFETLDRRIQKTGEPESLIGHSQGGLVAAYIGKKYPEHIDKVIALGAPFKGTYGAFLNYFIPGCRDMIPNSSFLTELDELPFSDNVEFYSVVSTSEHAVIPHHNALVHEDKKNVVNILASADIGHAKLITLHDLITSLLKFDSDDYKIEDHNFYVRDKPSSKK